MFGSRLSRLFLLFAAFLASISSIVSSALHEWLAFDVFFGRFCFPPSVYYRHGVRVGVCLRESEFLSLARSFSLWSDNSTVLDEETMSFRVDQSQNASFSLQRFRGEDCETDSLFAQQTIAALSPSANTTGEWPLSECVMTTQGEQGWMQLYLFREDVPLPPTKRFRGSSYEIMTYFEPEGDMCTDMMTVPGNFSVFQISECVPMRGVGSQLTECNVDNEASITYFPFTNNCSGESVGEVLPSTCPESPALSRFPWFPISNEPESANITSTTNPQQDRHRCLSGQRENDWLPFEEDSPPPTLAPTQQVHSRIDIFFSFSLSDVQNNSEALDNFFIRVDTERFACAALDIHRLNCACDPFSFSFSPQEAPHNTSLLRWTAKVNVTLHAVDFAVFSYNDSMIIAHAVSVLGNVSQSTAWDNYHAKVVLAFASIFTPSTQLVHTSVAVSNIALPPNRVVSVSSSSPSLSPSAHPVQSSKKDDEKKSLSLHQMMLISVVVGVTCALVIGLYACFFHANKKLSTIEPEVHPL